jgi:hypothetical protein
VHGGTHNIVGRLASVALGNPHMAQENSGCLCIQFSIGNQTEQGHRHLVSLQDYRQRASKSYIGWRRKNPIRTSPYELQVYSFHCIDRAVRNLLLFFCNISAETNKMFITSLISVLF